MVVDDTEYEETSEQEDEWSREWNSPEAQQERSVHGLLLHRRQLLSGAKHRASVQGLPFSITIEDIIIPNYCPILGIPLFQRSGKGGRANSPTLDRVVPELGYVRGNVQVISHRANRLKQDATLKEIEAIAEYIRRNTHAHR